MQTCSSGCNARYTACVYKNCARFRCQYCKGKNYYFWGENLKRGQDQPSSFSGIIQVHSASRDYDVNQLTRILEFPIHKLPTDITAHRRATWRQLIKKHSLGHKDQPCYIHYTVSLMEALVCSVLGCGPVLIILNAKMHLLTCWEVSPSRSTAKALSALKWGERHFYTNLAANNYTFLQFITHTYYKMHSFMFQVFFTLCITLLDLVSTKFVFDESFSWGRLFLLWELSNFFRI